MIQASLDQFVHEVGYVPVLILQGINVAWKDRDWYLHAQDVVDLDPELASLMEKRGFARTLDLSQSDFSMDGHGKALKSQERYEIWKNMELERTGPK